MQLHQLNLRFDPEQDRMILRINSTYREEFRFYITRRYLKLLWPMLRRLVEEDFHRRTPEKPDLAGPLIAFEEENAVGKVDFEQQFTETADRFPLGEEPVLLTQIKVKKRPQSNVLCMHPTAGKGIELPANQEILHIFCKALRDVVAKAQWDIVLKDCKEGDFAKIPSGMTLH